MIRANNDRHWKIFWLAPSAIINMFGLHDEKYEYINRHTLAGLPEDYVIDQVDYIVQEQAFRFLIYHPSFPLVPAGDMPKSIEIKVEVFVNKNVKKLTNSSSDKLSTGRLE